MKYPHCMNDSKDFQDAESTRSGNSHVTSRPVSLQDSEPTPEGMLQTFFRGSSEPQRRAAKHLLTTMVTSGNVFCTIQMRHHQHLVSQELLNGTHQSNSH